ncbi:uncharacterized protein LOC142768687 [Rhipicephalus microplus]|uniref:uncharacterized protein LOC142768687 n=1 Tax=Rhipicephalus microplus TaxID=6941 RepID=UPI003F6B2C9D
MMQKIYLLLGQSPQLLVCQARTSRIKIRNVFPTATDHPSGGDATHVWLPTEFPARRFVRNWFQQSPTMLAILMCAFLGAMAILFTLLAFMTYDTDLDDSSVSMTEDLGG